MRHTVIKLYHIYCDGNRITDKALSLDNIRLYFGSILELEKSGHRLVPAN